MHSSVAEESPVSRLVREGKHNVKVHLGYQALWLSITLQRQALSSGKAFLCLFHLVFPHINPVDNCPTPVYQVFESVAKKYDVMNDMMSLGIHRAWKDLLIKKMHPLPGTQLLDVAGGTGDIAFRFLRYVQAQHQRKRKRQLRAQQNLSWEEIAKKYQNEEDPLGGSLVIVCDINREMLKVGQQKALDQGHRAGLEWVLGDAEELPFDDDKFDVYTIAFGIRNVTHIDRALQEAHRVLKPGGRFLCLEFSQVNDPLISRLYDLYSFQVIPVIGEVIAGDWKSYQYLVESIRKFPNQEEFKEMIEDAGFQKVTYESLSTGIVAIHSGFKL
ncbi:2-methoxy-6-polyprenyl-1,4-benzoquinol methylase, mitochondrial [Onychomys torridus]|uniref:2-methoxy-6-polyprenyl-1,4-benzoquinol methylase, mitochondrial n=1 Tax=Onychomys torridus TaxID=38674 RepID=UPI00167FA557|nr:2-methoxy-6-polyprenyl-1,4-benzoquinol methylase, mitochondrial [Onychomys torridus]